MTIEIRNTNVEEIERLQERLKKLSPGTDDYNKVLVELLKLYDRGMKDLDSDAEYTDRANRIDSEERIKREQIEAEMQMKREQIEAEKQLKREQFIFEEKMKREQIESDERMKREQIEAEKQIEKEKQRDQRIFTGLKIGVEVVCTAAMLGFIGSKWDACLQFEETGSLVSKTFGEIRRESIKMLPLRLPFMR